MLVGKRLDLSPVGAEFMEHPGERQGGTVDDASTLTPEESDAAKG